MRRWLVRICVLLVLGAIVNVTVAWGFAARRGGMNIERNHHGYFVIWERPWQIVEERRLGMSDVWWYDLYDENPRSTPPERLVARFIAQRNDRMAKGATTLLGRPVEALGHPPGWGTFRSGAEAPKAVLGGDIAFGLPVMCLWMSATSDVVGNRTVNERLHGAWLVGGAPATRGEQFLACRCVPSGPGSRSTRCSMRFCCGCCSVGRLWCGGGGASAAACARSAPTTCAARPKVQQHAPNAA